MVLLYIFTWTKFAALIGYGKLFRYVTFQDWTLSLCVYFLTLDNSVETNAGQAWFQSYSVAVFKYNITFSSA